MWLWLWHRPAAVAPIQPLAWELPYVMGAALKRQKKKVGRSQPGTAVGHMPQALAPTVPGSLRGIYVRVSTLTARGQMAPCPPLVPTCLHPLLFLVFRLPFLMPGGCIWFQISVDLCPRCLSDAFLSLTSMPPAAVESQCPVWSPFMSLITFLHHALPLELFYCGQWNLAFNNRGSRTGIMWVHVPALPPLTM